MGKILALAITLMALTVPTQAMTLAVIGPASPTTAYNDYCSRHPGDCTFNRNEPEIVQLNGSRKLRLEAINSQVNRQIIQVTDQDHWGLLDRWDYPDDGMGDCEDMQILKRRLLIEAGFPRRALLITVVLDERGEGHAVLMVRTNKGDMILDNKTNRVLAWDKTGYTFIKREGADGRWVSLQPVMPPPLTSSLPQQE